MTSAHPVQFQPVQRVLVVEDSSFLRETLQRALARRFEDVRAAASVSEARSALGSFHPDLMVLDVELPDGTALDVMQAALAAERVPLALAISGTATPDEAFRLAQLGVRTYLQKPLNLDRLESALEEVMRNPIDITPQVRGLVGQRSIQEVEEEVRRTMLREALARAEGSRRAAARLLHVSRQLVQHMLNRDKIH